MLRNLKVGTKLFAILAAPVVVIVVLVTVGVRERLAVADSAERVEQIATFAGTSADLAQQLQVEGLRSVDYAASKGTTGKAELDAARAGTDAAVTRYRDAVSRVKPANEGGSVTEALRLTEARLGALGTARISVDIAQTQPYSVAELYDNTVAALVNLNGSLVQSANEADLLRGLDTVASLERIKQYQGDLGSQLVGVARLGTFTDRAGDRCTTFGTECDAYTQAEQASQDLAQANRAFDQGGSTPGEKQQKQNAQAAAQSFDEMARKVLQQATQNGNTVTVPAPELLTAAQQRLDGLASLDATFTRSVVDTARNIADEANRAVTLYLIGGLGALAVAFAIAVAVARSVTRPLERLTRSAYTLSTEQLPALVEQLRNPDDEDAESVAETFTPIPVHSRDEIGQLAEAFNSIQSVTVDVAQEQSRLLRKGIGDIFVNLARRNQSLLDRQIEFIDHLENHEKDPDQLDNLFKLDHLATRMRRNAESLLVLAGAEPPRRRGRPVPVSDVVRVAIGEVEDFARVHLIALDEATVAGNVAVDLAHLLSELMENATHFSPPDSSVEVLGRRDDRNGYVVTVTDRGIGMSAEQLAEANAQLARPPLVGLTLSRSLGFIVIGRLAARFGLTVTLEPTPNGGTTAVVTLPYSLVEYPGDHDDADTARDVATGLDAVPAVGPVGLAGAAAAPTPQVEAEVDAEPATRPDAAPEPVVRADAAPLVRRRPAPVAEDQAPAAGPDVDAVPAPPVPAPTTAAGLPSRQPARTAEPVPSGTGGLPSRRPRAGSVETAPAPTASGGAAAVVGATPTVAAPGPAGPSEPPAPTAADPAPLTPAGLVRRTPKARSATPVEALDVAASTPRPATRSSRSPEEVRRMLSRYRSGLDRGRTGDTPTSPDDPA